MLEQLTVSSRVTNKVIQHKSFNTCPVKDEESTPKGVYLWW